MNAQVKEQQMEYVMDKEKRIDIMRKSADPVLKIHKKNDVCWVTWPLLDAQDAFLHGFSTRLGGVSEGPLYSMNFSPSKGDLKENIKENYCRIADAIGFSPENLVLSYQTHTTNVRMVTEADRGKGFTKERNYTDVDGLITNVPGLVLATFYADCVPLFFLDPVHRAIGLSHSGWRGTVGKIGKVTLERMREAYGTDPADVIAAIGPSICQDCYEVSSDVIDAFREQFPENCWDALFYEKKDGKYQLNLWEANRVILTEAGVLPEHLSVTDLCTCCNPEFFYSHRASHGKRGNHAGFLMIRE